MSFSPTDEQLEGIREAADLNTVAQVTTSLIPLSDAQWAATVLDLAEWVEARDEYLSIKGSLLGANEDPNDRKLAVRNRIRRRLGFPAVNMQGQSMSGFSTRSVEVTTTL